ncbi:colicin immunity domain-containing protein [Thermoanaerobacterium saccharolyticum]|uniref:colicin immunity domain-containing protein n=1 Tax=Thermoanaerobacterium saccharolyticum TaxID=28896 RepID=UPI002FDB884F
MKAVEYLVELANKYLIGEIDAKSFSEKFESYFYEAEEAIYDYDKKIYNVLDNIREAIAYYESDENIREKTKYLIDDDELNHKVKINLEKLKNVSIKTA